MHKKIIEYFADHEQIRITVVISNNSGAGVLEIASQNAITAIVINNKILNTEAEMQAILLEKEVDYIILAGFLSKVPDFLIQKFDHRIINIHPSLLPKFGGKGMYGMHVHLAVKAANETQSGITIHYVNEHYDEGQIILQKTCPVYPNDSAEDIARKVLQLEHSYFAPEIEKICRNFQKKPY